jgi:protease I
LVTFTVDRLVGEASAGNYDALILPGGVVNPDNLRQDEAAVGFVRGFVDSGKPVGVICHGPWTLVEAGVVQGRTLTSYYPSVRTDIRNAGGNVVDQKVVTDQNITSSRWPDDLPTFCARIAEQFAAGWTPADRPGGGRVFIEPSTRSRAQVIICAAAYAGRPAPPRRCVLLAHRPSPSVAGRVPASR